MRDRKVFYIAHAPYTGGEMIIAFFYQLSMRRARMHDGGLHTVKGQIRHTLFASSCVNSRPKQTSRYSDRRQSAHNRVIRVQLQAAGLT